MILITLSRTAWNGSEVDIAGGKAILASADPNTSVRNKFHNDPEVLAEAVAIERFDIGLTLKTLCPEAGIPVVVPENPDAYVVCLDVV